MSQSLFFGGQLEDGVDARQFSMPPKGQAGDFDVRFHDSSRLGEGDEQIVRLQSSDYPLTMKVERTPSSHFGPIVVEELVRGEVVESHTIHSDEEISLRDENVTALRIKSASDVLDALPETFTLKGNYPNPFNPSTQLVFDMPQAGQVSVEVYDMLGRNVMSIPVQDVAAGAGRHMVIDASSLASGTYLYHLRVEMASQSTTKVGRMTLIK